MNKKVIVDLNGVVFEPISKKFSNVAQSMYGRTKGTMLTLAYKYSIGRRLLKNELSDVLAFCAQNPVVRNDAIEALNKIAGIDGIVIEFYGQMAFPGQEYELEQKYRAIAPCMKAANQYKLMSPFDSKREYLYNTTAADEDSLNYILGTHSDELRWPARWRIIPVWIMGSENEKHIMKHSHPRVFKNMDEFYGFLARHR